MENKPTSLPLAKATLVKELPGLRRKIFDVPAGRQGILTLTSGKYRLLPPGRHVVWHWFSSTFSSENGEWVGYFPGQPFTLLNDYPNLLTGDGELVDASILFMTNIKEPLQFFQSMVIPSGEIPSEGFRLPLPDMETKLVQLARRYAAIDLSAGLPTEFLLDEITDLLAHQLAEKGLDLSAIRVLSFIQASDRVEIADKLQQMEENLEDVRFDEWLASANNQQELDERLRQRQPEQSLPVGVRPVVENVAPKPEDQPKGTAEEPQKASNGLLGSLKDWLNQRPGEKSLGQARHVMALLSQGKPQAEAITRDRPANTEIKLMELFSGNKQLTDRLVRKQVDLELSHVADMLLDCRGKTYRNGDEPTAIQFMQMQRSLENQREHLQDPTFGTPAYVTVPNLSAAALGQMLAYDEGLLVQIANHSEFAHILQQRVTTGEPVDEQINILASRLSTFEHAFARRSRLIQLK